MWVEAKLYSLENLVLHMTFLKRSCSIVVACEEQCVFQSFVNPDSAIKNRVNLLPGLLIIKVMKNPCFMVVSEHSALL